MPFDLDVRDADWRRYAPPPEAMLIMTDTELPESVTPAQVGKACNMSRRAAKTMLRGAGIAECGDNGRWFVRIERLRERLPDVFDRVRQALASGAAANFLAE